LPHKHCVMTKGALFTTLANLNSGEYKVLPNIFVEVIIKSRTIAIEELELLYNSNGQITNLLNQLHEENYGTFYMAPQKANKPVTDSNIYDNIILSNIVIDFSSLISEKFVDVIEQLGCEAILISIYNIADNFFDVLKKIENSEIANLQVVITEKCFSDKIRTFLMNLNKLSHVVITDSSCNAIDNNNVCLVQTTDSWGDLRNQKEMDPSFFVVNKRVYFEAKTASTYFYKKLYIDSYGNIFNSPSSEKLLGILTDDISKSIMNILNDDTYFESSLINKEKCDVCKKCEYRFMCSDRRTAIVRSSKELYFIDECTYNPYIGKWKSESGYRSLTECGIISDAKELVVDVQKINGINKGLWGG
jgi:hypothetical protein